MKKCCDKVQAPFKRKNKTETEVIEGQVVEEPFNGHANGIQLPGMDQEHGLGLGSENAHMLETQRSFHSPRGSPDLRNHPKDDAWDAVQFKSEWDSVAQSGDRSAKKQVLAKIAADNYARYIGNKVHIPRSVLFDAADGLVPSPTSSTPNVIWFTGGTADACAHFSNEGVVVGFNFANGNHPGGGYIRGAMAQEEELCRQYPTLYTSLGRAMRYGPKEGMTYYPFGPPVYREPGVVPGIAPPRASAVIWTPDVQCLRSSRVEGYRVLSETDAAYHKAHFVSAAAPNVADNGLPKDTFNRTEIHQTLQNVMQAAPHFLKTGKVDTIVLGAWGCGAFGNSLETMAELLAHAVKTYGKFYKNVVFAVPPPPDQNAGMFTILTRPELFPHMEKRC